MLYWCTSIWKETSILFESLCQVFSLNVSVVTGYKYNLVFAWSMLSHQVLFRSSVWLCCTFVRLVRACMWYGLCDLAQHTRVTQTSTSYFPLIIMMMNGACIDVCLVWAALIVILASARSYTYSNERSEATLLGGRRRACISEYFLWIQIQSQDMNKVSPLFN